MQTVPFTQSHPIFSQLAAEAKVANLSRSEYIEYERSEKAYRDYHNALKYQNLLGKEEGLKKGLQRGKLEERFKIASNMKRANMALEDIAKLTGLSKEEVLIL